MAYCVASRSLNSDMYLFWSRLPVPHFGSIFLRIWTQQKWSFPFWFTQNATVNNRHPFPCWSFPFKLNWRRTPPSLPWPLEVWVFRFGSVAGVIIFALPWPFWKAQDVRPMAGFLQASWPALSLRWFPRPKLRSQKIPIVVREFQRGIGPAGLILPKGSLDKPSL